MSEKTIGFYDDDWWLEYMEKELDMNTMQDMEVLLKNSPADHRKLRELEWVRKLVKDSDDVALPEDGRVYDQLHAKVMASVHESALRGHAATVPFGSLDERPNLAAMWTALTRR